MFSDWRVVKATRYSINGLKSCFASEKAFRDEILISIFLVPGAFLLADNSIELIALIGSIFIVLITELLNTGIEHVTDRIGLEKHELSRKAKDVASAAVFVSLCLLVFVWVIVAWY